MNKRFIVASFSTCMLVACTSYNQPSSQNDVASEKEQISLPFKDSTIVPKDTASIEEIRLKRKANSHSRYKDLAKEKERRRKIRAKYKAKKLLKK
jgi:hypothetical protein